MTPGPFLNGPAGVAARAKTTSPCAARVSASRTAPSMIAPGPLVDHDLADQVADQRSAEVALAVDDEDVAGLGVVEGAVDGEVVSGPGEDRQGGADESG